MPDSHFKAEAIRLAETAGYYPALGQREVDWDCVAEWAEREHLNCTRMDYSGHGQSSGRFEDGTIGAWLDEVDAVFMRLTAGPQVLVGSSTGGYLALLLLKRYLETSPAMAARIQALVLIAPAWDLSKLMWDRFSEDRVPTDQKHLFLLVIIAGDGHRVMGQRLLGSMARD